MSDGKTVLCIDDPEKPHTVDRTLCLLGVRPSCPGCPNRVFKVRFQLKVVDQEVACPRWASEEERKERKEPVSYVMVARGSCLTKPYLQCESCPNSQASQPPRSQVRWWELEEKAKRLELDLDEEEKDAR